MMASLRTALLVAAAAVAAATWSMVATADDNPQLLLVSELAARILPDDRVTTACLEYWATWKVAVARAAVDCAQASQSTATATFLTLQPVVWLLTWSLRLIVVNFLYEIVLVRGIFSETAVRQIKSVMHRAVEWQLSLSQEQVAVEMMVLIAAIAVYQLIQFVQRRQYGRRLRRKMRAVRRSLIKVRL